MNGAYGDEALKIATPILKNVKSSPESFVQTLDESNLQKTAELEEKVVEADGLIEKCYQREGKTGCRSLENVREYFNKRIELYKEVGSFLRGSLKLESEKTEL